MSDHIADATCCVGISLPAQTILPWLDWRDFCQEQPESARQYTESIFGTPTSTTQSVVEYLLRFGQFTTTERFHQ